jgi:hypothetical protein
LIKKLNTSTSLVSLNGNKPTSLFKNFKSIEEKGQFLGGKKPDDGRSAYKVGSEYNLGNA